MKSGALVVTMGHICFSEPPTLDAILGGMAFLEHRDGPRAAIVPEVDKLDDVPMASRAILVGHLGTKRHTRIRSFSKHVRADASIAMVTSDRTWRKDVENTDHGKPAMTQNPVHDVTNVVFLARCEPEVVLARFATNPRIGTSRKDFGHIDRVDWVDLPDHDLFGIVGNGTLLRPVPSTMAARLGDLETKTKFGFWKSPYHPEVALRAGIEPSPVTYPTEPFSVGDIDEALAFACR